MNRKYNLNLVDLEWAEEPFLQGTLYRIYIPHIQEYGFGDRIVIRGKEESKMFIINGGTRGRWAVCKETKHKISCYGWLEDYMRVSGQSPKFYCIDAKPKPE